MSGKLNPAIASMMKTMLGVDPEQLLQFAQQAEATLKSFDERMNTVLEKQTKTEQHQADMVKVLRELSASMNNILEVQAHSLKMLELQAHSLKILELQAHSLKPNHTEKAFTQ